MSESATIWAKYDEHGRRIQSLEAKSLLVEHRVTAQENRAEQFLRDSEKNRAEILGKLDEITRIQNRNAGAAELARWAMPLAITVGSLLVSAAMYLGK